MQGSDREQMKIAVVIPCYKTRDHILEVLNDCARQAAHIYVVDDSCPEHTGTFVERSVSDPKVEVLYHTQNTGVGGAVVTGYKAALAAGYDVIVKIDGDGQMDAAQIPLLVEPIMNGHCDYSKGNRFFNPEDLRSMPSVRLFGNA